MVHRKVSAPVCCMVLLIVGSFASVANATVPVLVSAVSRMTHGSAGSFDIQLPLTSSGTGSGIECRTVANGLSIVLTFDQAVVSGSANVTSGTAIAGTPTFNSSAMTMTVPLTGVANFQTIALNLINVSNASSQTLASATVYFRTLQDNVKASGTVLGNDLTVVRAAVAAGSTVNSSNFRCDINALGILTGADVNLVRIQAALNSTVPGGATNDTAPTITAVASLSAISGQTSTPVGFTVGDAESAVATLGVTATSSDQNTLPASSIIISGTGASRSVAFSPPAGITVDTPVTVSLVVSDGVMTSFTSFTVTVLPPPTTYLATLGAVGGTSSLGSGSATLVVSGDLTSATLTYSYSNLSGTDSEDAIYAPGNDVLFDITASSSSKQTNGSYLWTFKGTLSNPLSFVLSTIQNNQAYITIDSSKFPSGELTGTFQLVTGSQNFTAPAAPPAITINPPTIADASRFMQQAAFGGTSAEISNLSNTSFSTASTALNTWLNAQYALQPPITSTAKAPTPAYAIAATVTPSTSSIGTGLTYSTSSMYAQIYQRVTQAQSPNAYADGLSDDRIHETWYKNAITAPDQLRQRVATALSEIFVVSQVDDNIDGNEMGLASYYDMLADDAFGNFRTLMTDVTLHPCMGEYLNMAGNGKTSPNENYAREVMQLFTIGLYMLQPDGTLMLDVNGQPIPTYSQTTITQFAQVYTGWNYPTYVTIPTLPQPSSGNPVVVNVNSYYNLPMVLTASNHNTASKTLLSYTGAATYPGASQAAFIPANSSQTATTALAELNFALDNIFNHPNVGPFFCKKLIQHLVESNPSPAYVYRVAQVFANDGTGVRGNLQAVITAILTDYEARSPNALTVPGYGHEREPIIRMCNILRSLNARSTSGKWYVGKTDNALAQTIFRSPTVFNFFDPAYQQPGPIQQAGLVSPEFDIIYETTVVNAQNMIYTGIYATYNASGQATAGAGFHGDNESTDVYVDFSTSTGSGLLSLAQSGGINALVNQVGLLLMGTSSMDPTMQADIVSFIQNNFTTTDYIDQVKAAVYLVSTSAQCSVQK